MSESRDQRLHLATSVLRTLAKRRLANEIDAGGNNVNRLEFIFQAVNAIASKKHDAVTEYMLAQAILHEIDTVKGDRHAKTASVGSCR